MCEASGTWVNPVSNRWAGVGCEEGVSDDGRAKDLERVLEEATGFLDGLPGRRGAARADVDGVAAALRRPLSEEGSACRSGRTT